ncbi:MAG TPA: CBS domain-containing protein [Rhizomicrobium sp.]
MEELSQALGSDRNFAWKILSIVLHKLRDRLPLTLAAHLGGQLPLLVRGVYYDQFEPTKLPLTCDFEAFVAEVDEWLADTRPVDPDDAVAAVFALLSRHIPAGQIIKVQDALPDDLTAFWKTAEDEEAEEIIPLPATVVQDPLPAMVNQEQENRMQVQDLMTRDVTTTNPEETVQQAAKRMAELDLGALPVSENDRLVGIITDRDIAVRAIAEGKGPHLKVRDVMTPDIKYCFADQEIDEIASNMADVQVRRLPVVNRDKRLVGILSLGDIATSDDPQSAAEALGGISRPTNPVPQFAS